MQVKRLSRVGKSFIPDKVVVEEVDVYDFFVLFKKDQAGVNFAQGYWTKNRDKEWSLNTVLIFPHCQKNGYGGVVIFFSYLLLQGGGGGGAPEMPRSTKGKESFERFWKINFEVPQK